MGRIIYTYNPDAVEPPEPTTYECPICGHELTGGNVLYFDDNDDCIGCEDCIHTKYAEDYFED